MGSSSLVTHGYYYCGAKHREVDPVLITPWELPCLLPGLPAAGVIHIFRGFK